MEKKPKKPARPRKPEKVAVKGHGDVVHRSKPYDVTVCCLNCDALSKGRGRCTLNPPQPVILMGAIGNLLTEWQQPVVQSLDTTVCLSFRLRDSLEQALMAEFGQYRLMSLDGEEVGGDHE